MSTMSKNSNGGTSSGGASTNFSSGGDGSKRGSGNGGDEKKPNYSVDAMTFVSLNFLKSSLIGLLFDGIAGRFFLHHEILSRKISFKRCHKI